MAKIEELEMVVWAAILAESFQGSKLIMYICLSHQEFAGPGHLFTQKSPCWRHFLLRLSNTRAFFCP